MAIQPPNSSFTFSNCYVSVGVSTPRRGYRVLMLPSRPRIHSRSTSRSSIGRLGASFASRPQPECWWKGRRSSWIAHVSVGL
jgi:hypothetical protein